MGRADSPLRDRVIFIDGAPRSGTTWLVTLLAMHPDIAGVQAESHLFDFGVDRLFDNFEHRDPTLHGLDAYLDRDQLVDLVRDVCDGVLGAMRKHVSGDTRPRFVVEKTPVGARDDALDLERKLECYPDAWFLHIVREREAVVTSLMRSPFMADRSREACEALWDRVVGDIRRVLGGAERYLELPYERLRDDPAAACREVFEWVGVDAGEAVLDTMRAISHEKVSELGVPPPAAATSVTDAVRGLARRALQRAQPSEPAPTTESLVTFQVLEALHKRDGDALRALSHPKLEFVYRGPDGDRWLEGAEGTDAVAALAGDWFSRKYTGTWYGSGGGGPGEFWTAEPGKPFCAIFFSGLTGEATRVDLAIGLVLEDELVRRVVVVSSSPPSGRPVGTPDPLGDGGGERG